MTTQSNRTIQSAGAVLPPPTRTLRFTDNFGLGTHGPELGNQAKSAQIRAAEGYLTENIDDEAIAMMKNPPCRMIKVRGASFFAEVRGLSFTAEQIVSCLLGY